MLACAGGYIRHDQFSFLDDLGQSKIGDLRKRSRGEQNILGLEIPMDETGLFPACVDQPAADVNNEIQRLAGHERPAAKPVAQASSLALCLGDPLQEYERQVIHRIQIKATYDVGMLLQCHPYAHFSLKARPQLGVL
jgi:hypothetical protein